jgi:hypothetical protein
MAGKVGRPKKPKSEALGKFITARLRPDELAEIKQAIRQSGQSKSDWLRTALLGAARKK